MSDSYTPGILSLLYPIICMVAKRAKQNDTENACLKNTCIIISSAPNCCPAFDKNKYVETIFGDVDQPQTNALKCRTIDCYNFKPHLAKNTMLASGLLTKSFYIVLSQSHTNLTCFTDYFCRII